jgi:hypothetical protein
MREQHDDDDQGNRNAEKPEQYAATHFILPSAGLTLNCFSCRPPRMRAAFQKLGGGKMVPKPMKHLAFIRRREKVPCRRTSF